jgi:DNA-binding response OmpR family regulator
MMDGRGREAVVSGPPLDADPAVPTVAGTILVVEDQSDLRFLLQAALRVAGFEVQEAGRATDALTALAMDRIDLVLLDLGLPDDDGRAVLRTVRRSTEVPVIVLTGDHRTDVRAEVFRDGADDYITKPFDDADVVARVRAVLRRSQRGPRTAVIDHPPLRLDLLARRASVAGTEVTLSRLEFDLLAHLAARPGVVVSRDDCLRDVWRSRSEWQDPGTVTEHVHRLRSRLRDAGLDTEILTAVRGVGYRYDPPGG